MLNDLTKRVLLQLWPEEKFRLKEFGRMVLDENIQNYYADVESIAFDPGVTVPGMPARYHDTFMSDLLPTVARM